MSHPVVRNDRGAPTQLLAIVQDMTHQRGLEWTLHRSRALIDAAVATLPGTEITKDRGVIDALRAALAGAESTSRSLINGKVYVTLNAPMRDDAGAIVGVNSVNNNITAEVSADVDRQHKDAVRSFAARHDPLTGLLGRSGLVEHLGELAFSNSRPGALILLDLDDFNLVNDSLGNTIGDAVLLEVASRVSDAFPGVVMARYGADAFAIVAPLGVSQVEAVDAAERVRAALDPPVEIFGHALRITASQGIALEETRGLSTLLRDADSALAHAQLDGNGQCRFYDAAMRRQVQDRIGMREFIGGEFAEWVEEVLAQYGLLVTGTAAASSSRRDQARPRIRDRPRSAPRGTRHGRGDPARQLGDRRDDHRRRGGDGSRGVHAGGSRVQHGAGLSLRQADADRCVEQAHGSGSAQIGHRAAGRKIRRWPR